MSALGDWLIKNVVTDALDVIQIASQKHPASTIDVQLVRGVIGQNVGRVVSRIARNAHEMKIGIFEIVFNPFKRLVHLPTRARAAAKKETANPDVAGQLLGVELAAAALDERK